MKASSSSILTAALSFMVVFSLSQTAYAVTRACSDEEVEISGNKAVVLPNVVVDVVTPLEKEEGATCLLTFSGEFSIKEDSDTEEDSNSEKDTGRLVKIQHVLFFDPTDIPEPLFCFEADGPKQTTVRPNGVETHTFVNLFGNDTPAHDFVASVCLKSDSGKPITLGNHCLIIDCDNRIPYDDQKDNDTDDKDDKDNNDDNRL